MTSLFINSMIREMNFHFIVPDRRINIPSYIFYEASRSEKIKIVRSKLPLDDFVTRMGAFFKRMLNQRADRLKVLNQYTRAFVNHSPSFDKFASGSEYIIGRVLQEIE